MEQIPFGPSPKTGSLQRRPLRAGKPTPAPPHALSRGPSPAFRRTMRPLPQNARTESHGAAQPLFAALPILALLATAACSVGCAGSSGGAGSAVVPPPSPPPTPSSITVTITPATVSLLLGNTQTFAATVTGATDTTVSWSVNGIAGGSPVTGRITSAGVYTAPPDFPLAPTVQITATSNSNPTKSATATLTIASDVAIALAPSAVGVELGAIQPFRAAISSGGRPDSAIRWSISGAVCPTACGSLDANGNYTAPQILPAPATITVTAQSVADPSKQASAAVTITSNFPLQLSAPSSIASSGSSVIAATLTPVPGSNPNTTLSWTLSGAGCSGTTCGLLVVATTQALGAGAVSTSATYTAPVTSPSPNTVTITVTPQADPSKKAQANVTIQPGVGVTLSPGTATLAANHRIMLTAQVFGSANSAVAWTVNGLINGTGTVGQTCVVASIPCQPLTAGNNLQVDYQAPGAIPTPNPVTVRATSLADSTRSATAQITVINHDVVTVLPSTVTLAPLAVQQFSATVLGTSNQSVVWQIQGTPCLVAGACGAIDANGAYTAPGSAPSPDAFTIVAISDDDPSQSGFANLTSNSVSLIVAARNPSDEIISLTSAAPSATSKDIVVVDPSTAGVSLPNADVDLNVAALGAFSTANNSCSLAGNPVALQRPATGVAVADICLFSASGLDASMTYTVTGSGDVTVIAQQPAGLGIIHLTLQISAAAIPGARTLFIQNTNLDKTAATGALEVQ